MSLGSSVVRPHDFWRIPLRLGSSVVPPDDLGGFLLSLGFSVVLPHDSWRIPSESWFLSGSSS